MSKTFAVLNNKIVVNIIVADTLEIAKEVTNSECVEYTLDNPASVNWTFDGEKFIAPVVEVSDLVEDL